MNRMRIPLFAVLFAALSAMAAGAAQTEAGRKIDPLLQRYAAELRTKQVSAGSIHLLETILAVDPSSSDPRIEVVLRLETAASVPTRIDGLRIGSVNATAAGQVVTAKLPLSALAELAAAPGVVRIEAGRRLRPVLDIAVSGGRVDEVWAGTPAYTGEGVLVGVIDSGIDWSHDDFRYGNGATRIAAIWDMHAIGTPPDGFTGGAEYVREEIDAGTMPERDYNGHGTHVTGIAAGNGRASNNLYRGVAPEAEIVFVKAFDDETGGFTSTDIIQGLNYLALKAQDLGKPIAINLSLGGHQGPHDGTTGQEAVIDELSGAGLAICVAAGNEGESYVHDSALAQFGQMDFRIPAYTPGAGSGNDAVLVEIWVEDETDVTIYTPAGASYGPVSDGASQTTFQSGAGTIIVDNAASGADPVNGDRVIYIELNDTGVADLDAGDWTFGFAGGTGQAHAWVLGSTMGGVYFPDSDQAYSVSTPGTAESAITVAAWKSRNSWPSVAGAQHYSGSWGTVAVGDRAPFSSFGPTRDERHKPDLSAPGMAIVSCYSANTSPQPDSAFLLTGGDYFVSQGTSMSSPFACGVVALMLAKNGGLTAAEIKTALIENTMVDAYTGSVWNAGFGAGKIDAQAALSVLTPSATVPVGDLDGDGATTVLDVILLVNYILDPNGNPLPAAATAEANVIDDAVIDVADLVRVVAYILETVTPGKEADGTAVLELADPVFRDGRWWQPVRLSGPGLAAGQFALTAPVGGWDAQGIVENEPGAANVAARTAGLDDEQLRVLIYDLDNALPADGVAFEIPFAGDADPQVVPAAPTFSGARVVDAAGADLEVRFEKAAAATVVALGISPNPAVGATDIRFRPTPGERYSLSVYDLRGRLTRTLAEGLGGFEPVVVGWDGRDTAGRRVSSGIYFVRLVAAGESATQKLVLSR